LAAASAQRHSLFPEIPTFAELGFAGMDISLWYGIAAPANTPQPVVSRLNSALAKILGTSGIRESFAKQGADPAGGSPEQFDAFIRADSARWGDVIKQAGIKPE
jgi:tripartite-type tricarboxylate transporter receptor subunit TctC